MNGSMVPVDTPADSEYATPAPFPAGGAGLVSTTEDYLRFMTAMANGGTQRSADVGGEAPLPDDYANWANYAEQAPDSQPDSRIALEPQPAQSSEPTPVTASPAKAAPLTPRPSIQHRRAEHAMRRIARVVSFRTHYNNVENYNGCADHEAIALKVATPMRCNLR